jgi:uncharacterized protein with GYD domain
LQENNKLPHGPLLGALAEISKWHKSERRTNMVRYLVLITFTDKGTAAIRDSTKRAAAFAAAAKKAGASVGAQYWTQGAYDGCFVLTAPNEQSAASVVLGLAKQGNVKTTMLRAFDAAEFQKMTAKLPTGGRRK